LIKAALPAVSNQNINNGEKMSTYNDNLNKDSGDAEKSRHQQEAVSATVTQVGGETNEPPIIIGNGSLFMDLPIDKPIEADTPAGGPRPFRYRQRGGGTPIRAIGRIQYYRLKPVNENPVEWRDYDGIPEGDQAQVHIWLAELNVAGNAFIPVDEANPQMVIKGPPFSIEVDKPLFGPFPSIKSIAPFRFQHPGYNGRPFRIHRWMLIQLPGGVPSTIIDQSRDDDYLLHISFLHD
jgi:hypothetical protein